MTTAPPPDRPTSLPATRVGRTPGARWPTWSLPTQATYGLIYYNKDLFDQNNAPYPQIGWTWDDFVFAGSAVADPEQDVYGFVGFPNFAVIPFVYQHGGRILDDWRAPTRLIVDEPLTIEAIEFLVNQMSKTKDNKKFLEMMNA